jgi:hypothetical protein
MYWAHNLLAILLSCQLKIQGGIILATTDSRFQLLNHALSSHTITVKVNDNLLNTHWMITGVYGPQGELEKMFLRELKTLKQSTLDRWLIIGDFNLIYKEEDKNNNRLNRRLMIIFRRALNHREVKEIQLTGRRYTWNNGQESPTLTRIDMAFCTPQWEDLFSNPILQALSPLILDLCHHVEPPDHHSS